MTGWFRRRGRDEPRGATPAYPNPLDSLPPGLRLYAIGDVHGCHHLLERMHDGIDRMEAESPCERTVEVVLGDVVDRGPDSRRVVERLIARSREREVRVLLGNHEAMMLRFLADPVANADWLRYGGLDTLRSYGVAPATPFDAEGLAETAYRARQAIPAEHLAFLRALPLTWSAGGFTFVHAGLRPGLPLDLQGEADLTQIREPFLSHEAPFGTFVVHGHTPVPDVDLRPNRINLDTGAFATGRLSGIVIERSRLARIRSVALRGEGGEAAGPPGA